MGMAVFAEKVYPCGAWSALPQRIGGDPPVHGVPIRRDLTPVSSRIRGGEAGSDAVKSVRLRGVALGISGSNLRSLGPPDAPYFEPDESSNY